MNPDDSQSNLVDELERRLDRLWNDKPSLSTGDTAPKRFGEYEVQRVIGAGAFGIVYLATDTISSEPVALKIPRSEVLVDADKLQRFINEAKLIADLDHPNIVRLLRADVVGPVPWLATQWCDGSDLGEWIQQHRVATSDTPNWKAIASSMALVADAVHHVHQQSIAHRDLKPANIMLCSKLDAEQNSIGNGDCLSHFTPKVADFGMSKLHDGDIADTQSSVILGTPFYMAPEQMEGDKPTSSSSQTSLNSDIYSLGAVLFELLTGSPPVQGANYFEVMSNARSPRRPRASKEQDGVPPQLDQICSICLRMNPEARYESADQLAGDLRRYANDESIVGQKYSVRKRYSFWHGLQPWKKVAGAFTLFYCFVIGLWFSVTCFGFLAFDDLAPSESLAMVPQAVLLVLTSIILPGFIGWQCWAGKTWAAVVGFLLNLPKVIVYGSGMLGSPLMFREYYESYSPYLTFSVHLFFFVCTITQVLLYLCAVRSRA